MYAMLICLAGGVSVAVVMVLTKRATSVFTPLLWWLLLCPGLLSLFYGVALRSGPVRSASYGLGIWTMLVVMGNLTRDFFFISRAFRGSPPSMGLSETFWPAAIAGLLLALVGYLALWRSLVMHTAISTGAAVRTRIVNIPWAPITLAWAGGPPDRSRRAGQTRAGCTILRACRKQRGASAR